MKILIVGDFHSNIHEKALADAFQSLGNQVECFSWWQYFKGYQYGRENQKNFLKKIYFKAQNKFLIGPALCRLNKDFFKKSRDFSPDFIFIYRGTHIFPDTIKKLKKEGFLVFGYNNDDPFNKKYPFYVWRHFIGGIFYYNHIFAYRKKNLDDYKKIGYDKTSLLRSYYIKEKNFHLEKLHKNDYVCDVIFVGHFENDGRDEYIKAIIDAGINLKLYGPEWEKSRYFEYFKKKLGEIKPLFGEAYNLALNSAKIALVFLSKLNSDTYTRRCFEIIAAKTFMLSEYSDDLNSIFEKGKEADYFRNKNEMIDKIKYYLNNKNALGKIAQAGYDRLIKDGHEVINRAKEVIRVYNKIR